MYMYIVHTLVMLVVYMYLTKTLVQYLFGRIRDVQSLTC